MESTAETPEPAPQAVTPEEPSHPARELSLHLLRMFETRIDAAGIALQAESQRLLMRLQLRILAAAAGFIGIWGAIVLLAVALPDNLRVPVLGAVVGLFFLGAIVAWIVATRMIASSAVGSLHWFMEGLKLDLEVLARSLAHSQPTPSPDQQQSTSSDIAA